MHATISAAKTRKQVVTSSSSSGLQTISSLEDPPYSRKAKYEEQTGHGKTDADMHIGDLVEAPAKAADQVDDRVEERHRLPGGRQHADRVERATQKGERRDDEQGDELELLEAIGPDADDEAKEAEGRRGENEEGEHPHRVGDAQRHEEGGGDEDDDAEDDRLRRRGADVADDDLEGRDRRGEDFVNGAGEAREVDAE